MHRKFDGPLQKPGARPPIKNPEQFHTLTTQCQLLLSAGGSAAQKNMTAPKGTPRIDVEKDFVNPALAIAEKLTEMEPLRALPWFLKAQALLGGARLREALGACDWALGIDPSDPQKWEFKAILLNYVGRPKEAEQAQRQARELAK